jgi:hypothetical protein
MTSPDIDAARLTLALNELRLPAIKALWPGFAEQADKEGWSAARLLSALVEHELAERDRRRIERHLAQARLLPGKTLESFDFAAVPMLSRAHVSAITAGDSWIGKGNNILLFGPPGVGKSHLGSAIGLTLVQNGYRVLLRYAVNANLIFKWLRDPRYASDPAAVPSPPVEPRFLPVEIVAEAKAPEIATAVPNHIEIELAGGHRMRISGCYDPDTLARLIRGLSA